MMKKFNMKIWAGAMAIILLVSSCDDFLNVNENPNQAISADVQLVLPQAIVSSAAVTNSFNSYGGHFGGYIANAGGFSGFGTLLSYNLTPADYNGLWTVTYQDPLRDFNYVIENTEGVDAMAYYNAASKIMSVYLYQKLVDTFGDIPFSQALRGDEGIVAPAYDDAASVYQALIAMTDEAYDLIENAEFPLPMSAAADPLFGDLAGNTAAQMLEWQRFANTLKLKMLVRTDADAADFNDADFASAGFITNDAIVDPGYELNRPNPTWATWGRTVAGALSNSSRIPTTFSLGFFNGAKIDDVNRGRTTFVNFPATPSNQLGNEVGNPTIVAGQVTWAGTGIYSGLGVLKGPAMGTPLMLLAEAKFLQAEAQLDGKLAGSYITSFNEGITASFAYMYKDQQEVVTQPVAPLVADYLLTNDDDYLVDIAAATTDAQRLEAIITQKYIAVMMINSDEAYNEFRRTTYPVTQPGGAPAFDIASNKSTITERFDRLPTRVMYPSSESSYNAANYRNIDYRSELIFWDPS